MSGIHRSVNVNCGDDRLNHTVENWVVPFDNIKLYPHIDLYLTKGLRDFRQSHEVTITIEFSTVSWKGAFVIRWICTIWQGATNLSVVTAHG